MKHCFILQFFLRNILFCIFQPLSAALWLQDNNLIGLKFQIFFVVTSDFYVTCLIDDARTENLNL